MGPGVGTEAQGGHVRGGAWHIHQLVFPYRAEPLHRHAETRSLADRYRLAVEDEGEEHQAEPRIICSIGLSEP